MPFESHERARLLLDRDLLEGISTDDRCWLDSHLGQCAECARYAALSTRAVQALDSLAFELDPAAALRVQNVVRERAARLGAAESHARSLWLATAVALFLTIGGSLAMWQPAAWLAGRWSLPSPAWQIAFAMFWLLPSLLLAALPLLRGGLLPQDHSIEGETL